MSKPAPRATEDAPAPGTSAWWTLHGAPASVPERRRGRPPRCFEDIVAVASELVDEHGASGVNMRMLAERLNTSTATLYRHVSGKDELMVHVVDRLLGEVQAADAGTMDAPYSWREALRQIAFGYRRFLAAHPNVLPLLVAQLPIGPNALAIRERSLATLDGCGFSRGLAARVFTTLLQYVVGSAVTQAGSPGPQEAAAIGDYYRSLDAANFPHVSRAAAALTETSLDEEFVAGLEIVLHAIEHARERSGRRAPAPTV